MLGVKKQNKTKKAVDFVSYVVHGPKLSAEEITSSSEGTSSSSFAVEFREGDNKVGVL